MNLRINGNHSISKGQGEKTMKKTNKASETRLTLNVPTTHVRRIPEGIDRKGQIHIFEEIIAKNCLNLMKNINLHVKLNKSQLGKT